MHQRTNTPSAPSSTIAHPNSTSSEPNGVRGVTSPSPSGGPLYPTKYGANSTAPANGIVAAATQRQRHVMNHAAYRLNPMYTSQNGAMSHVLMTSSPPSDNAANPSVNGERRVSPRLSTCAAAQASTSSSNGSATK